jgi:hypothetical protein
LIPFVGADEAGPYDTLGTGRDVQCESGMKSEEGTIRIGIPSFSRVTRKPSIFPLRVSCPSRNFKHGDPP